jgi:hypothetical protein
MMRPGRLILKFGSSQSRSSVWLLSRFEPAGCRAGCTGMNGCYLRRLVPRVGKWGEVVMLFYGVPFATSLPRLTEIYRSCFVKVGVK